MSARLELDDLPPRYRAQAEAQIAARQRGKCTHTQPMAEAASAAGQLNKTFDSYGEYVYYIGTILPGIQSGKIVSAEPHPKWTLLHTLKMSATSSEQYLAKAGLPSLTNSPER